jgi:pimeloyl-ACP methyl ester carboxylesterase
VMLVPASAAVTGLTVWVMGRAPLRRPAAVLAAVLVASTVVSVIFVRTRAYDDPEPGPRQAGSLLLMSGINSRSGEGAIFQADVQRLGYECEQVYYFSYAGTGGGQPRRESTCPIRTGAPYEPVDTQRPVEEQVALFAEQTANLQRPLTVAAHSHAGWIAWEAVATGRAQVDVLILVGVFPDTPLGFPPPQVDRPGRVFGDLLRWAVPAIEFAFFPFDPDTPAARQLLGDAGSAQAVLGERLPEEVRVLSIASAADLPLMPHGRRLDVERNGCPVRAAHSSLPTSAAFDDEVIRFLNHRDPVPCPAWRDWGAVVMQAFGVPPTER